jgi:hypothetical protein
MIIDEQSPLRSLPVELNRPQVMFLDAVRYSVDMADLAYNRLSNTLSVITHKTDAESGTFSLDSVLAIQDAWTIVDSTFRLRCLLERIPNFKQKSPGLQSFFRQTKDVENLRNVIQHLDTEIPKLIELNIPAWGALSWAAVIDAKECIIRTCTIIPGTVFPGAECDALNPAGRKFHGIIDYITLQASNHSVCLSEIMRSVETLIKRLTPSLKNQIYGLPTAGSDVTLKMDFHGDKSIQEGSS